VYLAWVSGRVLRSGAVTYAELGGLKGGGGGAPRGAGGGEYGVCPDGYGPLADLSMGGAWL